VSFGGFNCCFFFVVGGASNKLGSTLLTLILTPLKPNPQPVCGLGCTLLNCDRTPSEMRGPSSRTGEGDQRGGEWEPIKITHSNLAYIPNFKIRHALSPEKNGQVLSSGKSDEFSALVKSDKMNKQIQTSFQPW
jgi:hypothetical protein